jgi:HPt (histidine-containing phosphotransfer) domain-containing protein
MDALYAKFLPQFTALANERMQRAYEASARPDGPDGPTMTNVMRDLHSIAGEAGLLGLASIVPIARNAEEHAKRLRDSPTDAAANAGAFVGALDELKHAIEAAGASIKPT